VGNSMRPRSTRVAVGAALAVACALAAACDQAATARPAASTHRVAAPTATPAVPAVGPHGGVDLKVLVVTDGTGAVEAIRQQLTTEGMPVTVVDLRDSSRLRITRAFLSRTLPNGTTGGNFDGVVLPSAAPRGLSGAERKALASYEHTFGVRQVDAYSPPTANVGMNPPAYSGMLSGRADVTKAGAAAGFGYLNRSFPFLWGPASVVPYGYLAEPLPGGGATPLVTLALPYSSGAGTLVWQYTSHGRQQLVIGFGSVYHQSQFLYLAPGIVNWVTRGVHLGDWHSYLDIAYDDMFLGDSQWSPAGHCTPGETTCPPGTPMTAQIRMTPADVAYAVRWERQHHFKMEFLYNGGGSAQFRVNGIDPLLAAVRPVAKDFYWVNHTYGHAYFGCKRDVAVVPWQCVRSGGRIVWAAGTGLINSQILSNVAWARRNGIPAEPGVLASGEYSGLRILPQQPVDNPYLVSATSPDKIKWMAMDASREPAMRHIGAALGVPRHPIDVGYDVDTVAAEVNEFNWYNTSKADGGSGLCQGNAKTRCIKPLDPKTGWTSYIVPGQVKIVYTAMLSNDPRPFFMHQSNLAGERIAYPVMDAILAAYRSVFAPSAPIINMPMSGAGEALWNQTRWAQALRAGTVSAWVQGAKVTVTGPAGTAVPLTVPATARVGSAAGPAFGSPYGGERSGSARLGSRPLTVLLSSAPYRSAG
jgi:hypothetical protein